MTQNAIWTALETELDRWRQSDRTALFWLRDDDAVAPGAALDRLLDLTARHAVPVTLAVIPEPTGGALAHRLEAAPHAGVAVHGWSHVNHAGAGEKKQELGPHRSSEAVLAELGAGFVKLSSLFGQSFVPVLVPPWNRIDNSLLPGLSGIGYRALSVFGPEKPAPIRMVNSHVDLIDWHGTRGGRSEGDLVKEIVDRLRQVFDSAQTVGILGHHLVHDDQAWLFLERLFSATSGHPSCGWLSMRDILGEDQDTAAGQTSTI